MIKQYFYIDSDGNPTDLRTGNSDHQAKIEKHLEEKAEKYKYDPLTGEKIKIKSKRHDLVDGKIVESDQDFLILLEPLVLGEDPNEVQ